jgi:hypothetical protein
MIEKVVIILILDSILKQILMIAFLLKAKIIGKLSLTN